MLYSYSTVIDIIYITLNMHVCSCLRLLSIAACSFAGVNLSVIIRISGSQYHWGLRHYVSPNSCPATLQSMERVSVFLAGCLPTLCNSLSEHGKLLSNRTNQKSRGEIWYLPLPIHTNGNYCLARLPLFAAQKFLQAL